MAFPTSRTVLATLVLSVALAGCPSDDFQSFDSNQGDSGSDGDMLVSDTARRAVLSDIGASIIVPALRAFSDDADALQVAVDAHADNPGDATARDAAQAAWQAAMASWQRNEVLQLGPAGRASGIDATPGGADLRAQIYTYPFRTPCAIDEAALDGQAANENTAINIKGLGALEYLLYFDGANPDCPPPSGADLTTARAAYAQRLADFIAVVADDLVTRWEPSGGDFLAQWSNAGAGSSVYARPQDALDALSVALFYVEQETKDRKIAGPTGIGATSVTPCGDANCPDRLESQLSMRSGAHIRANLVAFRDVFTGVDTGMGMNDLLRGIDRGDLADDLITELDATLARLDGLDPSYDTAITEIPDNDTCINASANRTGEPPCALHGDISAAMDIFRGPIVGALSLATPSRAAGDND